jgi:hypothetical protein
MLPLRALVLIGEYSKPITRCDWRTFERSIPTNVFINEIDTLYEFDDNDLFKLVHTNMHFHIDKCLYGMTHKELDAFINYHHDTNNTNLNLNLNLSSSLKINANTYLYITTYVVTLCMSGYIGFELKNLRWYFINNLDDTIIINNVMLDNYIYVNIFFGTLYLLYHIGGILGSLISDC